ncbi:agmatinase family protein [Rubritalea tangerina]|uniref:Agmatinase family protein n=1 Tax=Rubritalea tangerina TaxID=430798 RepID=A0ABW4ZCW7_9BACT
MKILQDKATNVWRSERDPKRNPERTPGPIDIQRYDVQLEPVGIKTFFQLPVALEKKDLVAGQVDVAIFGAATAALPHSAGNMWAPAEIRYTRDWGAYGDPKFPLSWIEYETLLNPFENLTAVDYGDVGLNPYNQVHTLEEIRRVTREVASTGAIPFAVGGDHSVPNATYRGIVDVYGKKKVGFVHFDVHLDRGTGKFGAFYHSGSYMNMAVDEGLLDGKHVVQFGMGSPAFGEDLYDEILEEGGKVYHLHEIRRDGVDAIFAKMYEDLKDVELVYVSFDIDVFDMSYAPGTGSSEPTGMTPNELFPHLRKFAATKTIVGLDLVEFNPFYDNKGQQTARLCRRVMLQFLTGISMKKKGMDPNYINPRVSGKP